MRRDEPLLRAICALIALAPVPALANSGVGFFMVGLPVVLLALVPVIPLEALVLAKILGVPYRRALSLSWRANVRSTLWGFVLGIGLDLALLAPTGSSGMPWTKAAATVALVPMFFFSWWIEHRAVARLATEFPRSRIATATGAANLLSYAAMIAFVWSTPMYPARSQTDLRAHVSEAILAGALTRTSVAEFWMNKKRLPSSLEELGIVSPLPDKYSVAIERGGKISVLVITPQIPDLYGKHVVFAPAPDATAEGGLRWSCSSPDIEPKYLPATCR
jgi:hypothetical protein